MKTESHSTRNAVHWKRPLTMRDVMTPQPHTIGREQTLAMAHKAMRDHEVRHLPVLHAGAVVGILSQRDLYFLETIRGVEIEEDVVEDAMTTETYAVPADTPVGRVVRMMARKRYGCAVVLDGGKVTGVFTTTDALRVLAGLLMPPRRRAAAPARAS